MCSQEQRRYHSTKGLFNQKKNSSWTSNPITFRGFSRDWVIWQAERKHSETTETEKNVRQGPGTLTHLDRSIKSSANNYVPVQFKTSGLQHTLVAGDTRSPQELYWLCADHRCIDCLTLWTHTGGVFFTILIFLFVFIMCQTVNLRSSKELILARLIMSEVSAVVECVNVCVCVCVCMCLLAESFIRQPLLSRFPL